VLYLYSFCDYFCGKVKADPDWTWVLRAMGCFRASGVRLTTNLELVRTVNFLVRFWNLRFNFNALGIFLEVLSSCLEL
jgi:hypothetical protein